MRYLITAALWIVVAAAVTGADPETKPTAADDLKALQGRWKVTSIFWPNDDNRLPKESHLSEEGIVLVIEGNKLTHDSKVVATLANDLPLAPQQKEIGFRGNRLLMLSLPDGKGLLCSYHVEAEKVQIAYTHTAACHRGSGQVVYLERPSK